MNRRIITAAIIGILLMMSGSTIAVVTTTAETDEEPSHSVTTGRNPEMPVSGRDEFMNRAPIAPPVAIETAIGKGLAAVSKYRIRSGDTLGKIAKAWHISISKLACRNGIANPNVIYPGKWIYKNARKCKPVAATNVQRTVPAPRSNSNVESVIQFAISQVGEPYVYGAAGPDSWDCSGLVMVAFQQIGISLPHYTGEMINHGTPVSQSEMRRGDIVFPSSGHVGIYLGDGQYVNAPQPGESVKVANVYAFYAARRIV